MSPVLFWHAWSIRSASLALVAGSACFGQTRVIEWGTALDPAAQVDAAKALAKSLVDPNAATWRAKGDQRRTYRFPEANATLPYRVCVPASWDGRSRLALVMFLHGAGNTESSYLDQNNKQMVKLADQRGVVLVSPLGHESAYGTFLRLPAVFGKPEEVAPMLAKKTTATEKANELSEKDVLNVLELVKAEYPIDTANIFLTGHSMGSGGTWYLGGKYADLWRALAPMSGPFVTETGYPWDRVLTMPVFVTEGTGSATTQSSRTLADWMKQKGGRVKFKEVNADHGGMVPLVLSDVFGFFDSLRSSTVGVRARTSSSKASVALAVHHRAGSPLRIAVPAGFGAERIRLTLVDPSGRVGFSGELPVVAGEAIVVGHPLPAGVYRARFSGG